MCVCACVRVPVPVPVPVPARVRVYGGREGEERSIIASEGMIYT